MPKAPAGGRPLSAIFAINKPTGVVSMQLLNQLQPLLASSSLFKPVSESGGGNGGQKKRGKAKWRDERVKVGQGGTLDPLADGVLVLGLNGATKQLAKFLDCTKEYRAIGLLGCSTDSYDSEGKRVHLKSTEGITAERIEAVLAQFRGDIEQIPPVFSALKMDGKPLYEYARSGTPLPRPIPPRKATVHSLTLLSFTPGSDHSYEYPKASLPEKELEELERLQKMVKEGATVVPETVEKGSEKEAAETAPEATAEVAAARPPIFEIRMTVSGGTYVRSIVHDIGIALGSAAHVVKLTRTRQGEFTLNSELDPLVHTPANPSATDAQTVLPATEPVAATSATANDPAMASEEPSASIAAPEDSAIPPPPPVLETFAGGCVEWEVLEAGLNDLAERKAGKEGLPKDEDGMLPWEAEVLHRCKLV